MQSNTRFTISRVSTEQVHPRVFGPWFRVWDELKHVWATPPCPSREKVERTVKVLHEYPEYAGEYPV